MTAVIETERLRKRYGRQWALADCTLSVAAGRVVGLVDPNGAGKSTLLNLTAGLLAQDAPVYAGLSVAEHLTLGARLNPGWDAEFARRRIDWLGLDPAQRAGKMSGGQRAQLALTLAVGKRPELLILDEPVASLDLLARWEFLENLTEAIAERELSVVLSSHLMADLERTCDYLIVGWLPSPVTRRTAPGTFYTGNYCFLP